MRSNGSATPGTKYLVSSAEQAAGLFGPGSMGHLMARAFLANHSSGELYVIPLADAAGTKAEEDITFTGPATGNGTVFLRIAGQLVEVPVSSGDSETDIADAAVVAVNAATDLPVVATNIAGVLELEAKHAGTVGNGITLSLNALGDPFEVLPAGVGATLGAAALSGGATDPAPSGWVTAMDDTPFDAVICQYTASGYLDALRDELARRWTAVVGIQGTAFAAHAADVADSITFVEGRNDRHLSALCLDAAKGWLSLPGVYAAAYAGVAARELAVDPGRPLQTLPVRGIYAGSQEIFADRNTLAVRGAVTVTVTAGVVSIEADTLTYRLNPLGASDGAWFYVQVPFILQRIGRRLKTRVETRYPRHKLAADGTNFSPTAPIVTPGGLKGEIITELAGIEFDGFIEDLQTWKSGVTVQRDSGNPNRVNVVVPPDLINGLRVAAFDINFTA
jgi:phage tail sheath gpL-like